MKKLKAIATLGMACALVLGGTVSAAAEEIAVTEGETAVSGPMVVSLTKENPAPTFTVGIPAVVNITSADPAAMVFTMDEESLNAIPDGKKVSISIADAGYGDVHNTFALYSEDVQAEAAYTIFASKYSTRPTDTNYNEIGKLLVSFYGTEKVTDGQASISRVIKADDYDGLEAGTYEGYITFNIDVRAQ